MIKSRHYIPSNEVKRQDKIKMIYKSQSTMNYNTCKTSKGILNLMVSRVLETPLSLVTHKFELTEYSWEYVTRTNFTAA